MKRQPLIMVMILLSFFSSTRGRRSMLSEDDMEKELKMLNKPYVISFKVTLHRNKQFVLKSQDGSGIRI
jgi:hypothetical protein